MYTPKDADIIRKLAREYAEIAHLPVQQETRKLHKALIALKPIRPVVLMDELPWNELNIDGCLTLQCEDAFCRELETYLRKTLFKWKYMPADMVVPPYIPLYKHIQGTGVGVSIVENTLDQGGGCGIMAHEYIDQLATDEDVEKLHYNTITYDVAFNEARRATALEILGGILDVKLIGIIEHAGMWDAIALFRGVTNLLTDLVMRPEFMHKIVSKLTDIEIDLIRQYEALNLFEPAPDLIHCSVAYNDILPAEGFDPDHVRLQDVWGRGVAQIFTSVSPEMHDEFDMEYMKRILAPFGMVYYGCCEALHNKIHIVEKIPNLRKISITPWADVDMSADQMGKKYVLSAKPNPAHVGTPRTDKNVVRREVLHILEACRRNGTPCELTLKDISTVAYRPENLFDWERTVMETVKSF